MKRRTIFFPLAMAVCANIPAAKADEVSDVLRGVKPVASVTHQWSGTVGDGWTGTVASEVRYFSWRGDRGTPTTVNTNPGSGSLLYVPLGLRLLGASDDGNFRYDFLARGGWVHARQSTLGIAGEVATFLDTSLSGTVTYLGYRAIQPFVSLAVNAPTGRSNLQGAAANARMDPDLVEIGSFGTGWNVGPTVGFNLPVNASTVFTVSAGYNATGSYTRENSLTPLDSTVAPAANQITSRVNPGDAFTASAALSYREGPWWARLTGSIAEATATVENGAALFRAGRRYFGHAVVNYTWPETWGVTTLDLSAARSNRNAVLFTGDAALTTESFNTNSNVYRASVQHLVPFGGFYAGPTASVLYRDRNGYDIATLQFVPAKTRYSAGLAARYSASDLVTLNAKIEHVWTHEGEITAPDGAQFSVLLRDFVNANAVPVVSSTGWQFAGGLSVKF